MREAHPNEGSRDRPCALYPKSRPPTQKVVLALMNQGINEVPIEINTYSLVLKILLT